MLKHIKMNKKMTIKNIFQAICATFMLAPSLLDAQAIIGGTTPDPSAVLEIQSNNRGLLLSRMTTAQRNAIVSPAAGLMIFNTTTLCMEINLGTPAMPSWEQVSCRDGIISTLDCAGASVSGPLISIPYTGGNGGVYSGSSAASAGITGLYAALPAGNYASGAGTLTWTIAGSPSSAGSAGFVLEAEGLACSIPFTVAAGTISALNCGSTVINGTPVHGVPVSGVSLSIPYSGGNGGFLTPQTFSSTGVTGLTAMLEGGLYSVGAGNLICQITGTPSGAGTASFVLNTGGQMCTVSVSVAAGSVGALNCAGTAVTGTLTSGQSASGVSASVTYTGGNGGVHTGQTVTSTGVTGLTATVAAGSFASGAGNLTYTITGTPASAGTASFALNIGGQTCNLNVTVSVIGTATLNCAAATTSGVIRTSQNNTGITTRVPYTAGNGGTYTSRMLASTGVTGLTASLSAGNFATGAGSLSFTITGTPSGAGAATFALDIGGQSCNFVTYAGCGAFIAAGNWKEFSCYNLGAANESADPFTPSWEIIGGYWQWGRKAQAAQGPSGPGSSQTNEAAISGWNNIPAAPDGSWSDGAKTASDPCPPGFRVPTSTQWNGVMSYNTKTNTGTFIFNGPLTNYSSGKIFGNNLMLPTPGLRGPYNNGVLQARGFMGIYWSSTGGSDDKAGLMIFTDAYTIPDINLRRFGYSVRCITE